MAKKSGNNSGNKSGGSSTGKQNNKSASTPKIETFSTTNKGGTTTIKKGKDSK